MPDPLDQEQGGIAARTPAEIALLYPASYHVGMSSLGPPKSRCSTRLRITSA